MYYVLGVAAVGFIAYAWLSGEEQSAISSYHNSSRRLAREVNERQQQLDSYRKGNRAAQDFYQHIELHYNSVLTGNHCYSLYDEQKQILNMLNGRIDALVQQLDRLKKQRDCANSAEKPQIREQLNTVRSFLKEANIERTNIKQQKETLLFELRDINQKTHGLKLYIRDKCGKKGHDWFQRGLERRSV